jgi:hypothetical protein
MAYGAGVKEQFYLMKMQFVWGAGYNVVSPDANSETAICSVTYFTVDVRIIFKGGSRNLLR